MSSYKRRCASTNIEADSNKVVKNMLKKITCAHCDKPITQSSLLQSRGEWYDNKYYCIYHTIHAQNMRTQHEVEEVNKLNALVQEFGGLETGEEPRTQHKSEDNELNALVQEFGGLETGEEPTRFQLVLLNQKKI
jgi:hypothetical protein